MTNTFAPTSQHRRLAATATAAGEDEIILAKIATGEPLTSAEFARLAVAALTNKQIAQTLLQLRTPASPVANE